MSKNPVFQEGVQVYFVEGHLNVVFFYLLVILAPVEFLALFIPSLDVQMWTGSANLFKVTSITALLLLVYFGLRVANLEFSPWRFLQFKRWFRDKELAAFTVGSAQLSLLAINILLFVLVCAPLLVWAGAIARTEPLIVVSTVALLFFYSFGYGVWGLVTAALWEHRLESRQVLIRCLFFCFVMASALIYLPLNPVAYILSYVGKQELTPVIIAGWKWSGTTLHFAFHALLFFFGLLAYGWVVKRGASR